MNGGQEGCGVTWGCGGTWVRHQMGIDPLGTETTRHVVGTTLLRATVHQEVQPCHTALRTPSILRNSSAAPPYIANRSPHETPSRDSIAGHHLPHNITGAQIKHHLPKNQRRGHDYFSMRHNATPFSNTTCHNTTALATIHRRHL